MTRSILSTASLFAAALAAGPGVADTPLDPYLWVARPVIVFADSDRDPRLATQLEEFARAERELEDRDVVVIIDTDPESALRTELRPRDFMFVLVGKDGEVKYRKPRPVPVRELSRVIDKMPMRQQEMRSGS
ncbi:MAG: DUF4174 domain-containing protein [Pseudomonadota bacterium]